MVKRTKLFDLDPILLQKVKAAVGPLNSAGFDPWGLDPESLCRSIAIVHRLYTDYFRVKSIGMQNIPKGRVMIVANHSGQLPFDALMAFLSLILDANPPRIGRGMVDYWVPKIPFISSIMNQGGAVVGSPQNCIDLLESEQCVMVYPEGTRGLGKPYSQRYKLQPFGTGFMRLALETHTPIVPLSIIGAEDLYPYAVNIKPLAKLLGFPYFPVTPFFPLFGLLGALPTPRQISLRYGSPMEFVGDPDMPDDQLDVLIERVKMAIMDGFNTTKSS